MTKTNNEWLDEVENLELTIKAQASRIKRLEEIVACRDDMLKTIAKTMFQEQETQE